MRLTTSNGLISNDATSQDITTVFSEDHRPGEFIILEMDKQNYIQTAGEGYSLYQLEYREGSKENHFATIFPVDKAKVKEAFMRYLSNDQSFKQDFEWKALFAGQDSPVNKPWWKFW